MNIYPGLLPSAGCCTREYCFFPPSFALLIRTIAHLRVSIISSLCSTFSCESLSSQSLLFLSSGLPLIQGSGSASRDATFCAFSFPLPSIAFLASLFYPQPSYLFLSTSPFCPLYSSLPHPPCSWLSTFILISFFDFLPFFSPLLS